MPTGLGLGLKLKFGGQLWSPSDLGASLLGWWDAEDASTITASGGSISSWKDKVAAYDAVQATGASKPAYSASSFNSRAGVTFDGVDDELTLTGIPAAFPTGATAGEIWLLADQKTGAGTAGSLRAFFYGDADTGARGVYRTVNVGVNNAAMLAGTGGATVTRGNTSVDFSGRHVVRGMFTGTVIQPDVDGTAGSSTAAVPNTAAGRVRLGASSAAAATGFGNYTISAVLVTGALDSTQATQLLAYLKARGGIA